MGRRGELQQVELLDSAAPDQPPVAAPPRSRLRLGLIAGAAAVVLGLGVTQWVLTARENAATARIAQLPGVLAPMDDTLEVVRRLTPEDVATLHGERYGTLVVAEDGSQSYRWVEPGGEGWTTPLLGPLDGLEDGSQVYPGSTCSTDEISGTGGAERVVCLVTNGAAYVSSDGRGGGSLEATTREIVVLDTADGSERARWPLAHGYGVAVLPGSVVAVSAVTDDGLVVTAYDALTGRDLWTQDDLGISDDTPRLFRVGDLLALPGVSGDLTLLSTDGAIVRSGATALSEEGTFTSSSLDTGDGTLLMRRDTAGGTSLSLIVSADGSLALDGAPLEVGVDDGSVPGLLLTGDRSVYGYDAETGATWWTKPMRVGTTALVLRGRVYVTTAREVVALDGRSGRELWRSDALVGLTPTQLLTDGTHVLVATDRTGTDAVPALVAYDPASGTEVFRAPYPQGVTEVSAIGRTLVGRDAAGDERVELG
jgi:outer membrane protein assembly factor BamB